MNRRRLICILILVIAVAVTAGFVPIRTLAGGKPLEHTRSPLRELIMDTIHTRGTVNAEIQGRIVRIKE